MEPEGSVPYLNVPSTCRYPEPDHQSSPCPRSPFLWRSILILSSQLSLDLPSGPSSVPHTCYMPSPSHSSWFDHPNSNWWAVQIIICLVCLYLSCNLMCICLSHLYLLYLMCICCILCVFVVSYVYLLYLTCICCILCVFVVLLCVFVVLLYVFVVLLCVFVVLLCVFVVLCVYWYSYFRRRTAG